MIRSLSHDPAARELFADWQTVARDAVDALRLAAGYDRNDPAIAAVVDELLADSEEFAALGHHHNVGAWAARARSSTIRTSAGSS
ncbi:hypothetical protein O3W51_01670 [Streptomyces sp. H39-C1]|nr:MULTISPECIES: hypothetical protein [Streptomyces]MCZ4095032.1 hypothetical protein [Streptomyces sp. H39-C1]